MDLIPANTGSLPSADITKSFMSMDIGVSALVGAGKSAAKKTKAKTTCTKCDAQCEPCLRSGFSDSVGGGSFDVINTAIFARMRPDA